MISGGYLRAIRAPLVAGAWCPSSEDGLQGSCARRWSTGVSSRSHAPGQNLVGRSLWLLQREQHSDHHRRRHRQPRRGWPAPQQASGAVRLHVRLRRELARPRVRRAHGRPGRLRHGSAPHRPRAGSEARSVRPAAGAGGARRGARSAAARCGDARPFCRRGGHAGGGWPLQPVHARGLGALPRDGGAAGHRCRAAAARALVMAGAGPAARPAASCWASC